MEPRITRLAVGRFLVVVGFALLVTSRCFAQHMIITHSQATDIAREWVGEARAEVNRSARLLPEHNRLARALASWSIELQTSDGWHHGVQVDALTGLVLSWCKYRDERLDSASEPGSELTLDESLQVAEAFSAEKHPSFASGRWVSALGSPRKGQMSYQWAWDEVIDASSVALGPSELFVEVSDQAPEVITFWRPAQVSIMVSTRPSIGRAEIPGIARRFALLDPARYPVNYLTLRVQMDEYGSQRLVWECYQILEDRGLDGVLLYAVVYDAHTGEPLYPIAPYSRSSESRRRVAFPQRCTVSVEPGRRSFGTTLEPPRMVSGSIWVRAEHLRAADGIRVDAQKGRLAVHRAGTGLGAAELGARWRDYGWWVPLRRAAKALGWRVEWLHAKKEAVVHTVERRAAPAP